MTAGERREVILREAKKLFASRGYAATSLDDVAAAVGVTKPVVYDHFPSKRELYIAVMETLHDKLIREAATGLSATGTPTERFRAAVASYFRQVKRDPDIVELLYVQPRTQPELMREWQRLEAEAIAGLESLMRSLAPRLHPWQGRVAVHLLHHGLNATATAWPRTVSEEEMTDLVVRLLWHGFESMARPQGSTPEGSLRPKVRR
jgi:AcrR family transcriptional regulator